MEIVEKELVEQQAQKLTTKESGCEYMFNESKIDQLKMMYKVFSRVETTLKFVIDKMNPYIERKGGEIVSNEDNKKDPIKFTTKLLGFKKQIDELIKAAFSDDMKF